MNNFNSAAPDITDDQRQEIMRRWNEFDTEEQHILFLRFGLDGTGRSLSIATQLSGLPQDKINEIEARIFKKLETQKDQ